jgi:hypothetical protein
MNVKEIVDSLDLAIEPTGYKLWFGLRSRYNEKRNPQDKEVILEPFTLRPERVDKVAYDTSLTFWVGLRRNINEKFTTSTGDSREFVDELLVNATAILTAIESASTILVKQKSETIEMRYYEADMGATVNSQAFITFTIPVRIWR